MLVFTVSGFAVSAAAQDCVPGDRISVPSFFVGTPNEIVLEGDLVYIAAGAKGMMIFDVTNLANPVLLSETTNPGGAADIAVVGSTAYLATVNDLRIFDVSDPTSPVLLSVYDAGAVYRSVAARDHLVYTGSSTLDVLDMTDPANPQRIDNSQPGAGSHFTIEGDRLYDGLTSFRIYDLTDPEHPVQIGFFDFPGTLSSIAVSGNLAYLTDPVRGLRILDVADPSNITEICLYNNGPSLFDVAVEGDFAYIGAGDFGGVRTLDVSDPTTPYYLGTYEASVGGSDTLSVAVRDQIVFLGNTSGGFQIVEMVDRCLECPADINGDGRVDQRDFTAWVASFNAGAPACDQNGDHECTPADFTAWIANYNTGCP